MDTIELINNFITTFKNLPSQDKECLEDFRKQLDKAICDIYGTESHYRKDLKKIRFTPRSFYATEEDYLESWAIGINNVIKLLEDIRAAEERNRIKIHVTHEHVTEKTDSSSLSHSQDGSDNNSSQEGTPPLLLNHKIDSLISSSKDPIEDQFHPEFVVDLGEQSIQTKKKDSLSDYILELEFAPDSETINIDEIQQHELSDQAEEPHHFRKNSLEPKDSTEFSIPETKEDLHPSPSEKTIDKIQKTKIEQLESTIEKIRKSKLRAVTISSSDTEKDDSAALSDYIPEVTPASDGHFNKQSHPIYITYGYNEAMKDEVVATLQKLDLDVILRRKFDEEEKTIVKNFSDLTDLGFAVVILSGDDFGYSKDHESHQAKLRARQQLVFELGFLVGKLGRDKVFVLHQDSKNFEFPTGFFDILYTPYFKMGGWKFELLRQLKKTGYYVDANKLL